MSKITTVFQNEDGTWPSALECNEVPMAPPDDHVVTQIDLYLERKRRHDLEVRLLEKCNELLEKYCELELKLKNMEGRRTARHEDMAARIATLENENQYMRERLDMIEHNLREGVYSTWKKKRKMFDFDWENPASE